MKFTAILTPLFLLAIADTTLAKKKGGSSSGDDSGSSDTTTTSTTTSSSSSFAMATQAPIAIAGVLGAAGGLWVAM